MLFALIPVVWLSVLALFAALCRAASYGDADYSYTSRPEPTAASREARLRNELEVLA
jgi:hypothetical protein